MLTTPTFLPGLAIAQSQSPPGHQTPRTVPFNQTQPWLPQAKYADSLLTLKQTSILLTVLSDNEFYLGPDRIAPSEITQRIASLRCRGEHEEDVVFIKSVRVVRYATIATLLGAIRRAGIDRIGLVVRDERRGNELGVLEVQTTELKHAFVSPEPCKKVISLIPPPPPPAVPPGTKLPDKDDPCCCFTPDPRCDRIIVTTTSWGDQLVLVNWLPMTLAELAHVLRLSLEHRPDKSVFLKARKVDKYEDVVQMIDVIHGAGGQPIGLQIDYLE
jgi:biopolymer transport protein ExbD